MARRMKRRQHTAHKHITRSEGQQRQEAGIHEAMRSEAAQTGGPYSSGTITPPMVSGFETIAMIAATGGDIVTVMGDGLYQHTIAPRERVRW